MSFFSNLAAQAVEAVADAVAPLNSDEEESDYAGEDDFEEDVPDAAPPQTSSFARGVFSRVETLTESLGKAVAPRMDEDDLVEELKIDNKRLEVAVMAAEKERDAALAERERLERAADRLTLKLEALGDAGGMVEELRSKVEALQVRAEAAEAQAAELRACEERTEQAEAAVAELKRELAAQARAAVPEDAASALADATAALAAKEAELSAARADSAAALAAKDAQLNAALAEAAAAAATELESRENFWTSRLEESAVEPTQADSIIEELRRELDEARSELVLAKASSAEIKKLKTKLKQVLKQNQKLDDKYKSLEKSAAPANDTKALESARARIAELEERAGQAETRATEAENALAASESSAALALEAAEAALAAAELRASTAEEEAAAAQLQAASASATAAAAAARAEDSERRVCELESLVASDEADDAKTTAALEARLVAAEQALAEKKRVAADLRSALTELESRLDAESRETRKALESAESALVKERDRHARALEAAARESAASVAKSRASMERLLQSSNAEKDILAQEVVVLKLDLDEAKRAATSKTDAAGSLRNAVTNQLEEIERLNGELIDQRRECDSIRAELEAKLGNEQDDAEAALELDATRNELSSLERTYQKVFNEKVLLEKALTKTTDEYAFEKARRLERVKTLEEKVRKLESAADVVADVVDIGGAGDTTTPTPDVVSRGVVVGLLVSFFKKGRMGSKSAQREVLATMIDVLDFSLEECIAMGLASPEKNAAAIPDVNFVGVDDPLMQSFVKTTTTTHNNPTDLVSGDLVPLRTASRDASRADALLDGTTFEDAVKNIVETDLRFDDVASRQPKTAVSEASSS